MVRREYTAGRATTLDGAFNIGATTFTIADDGSAATWPTSTDYDFFVTIDAGLAQEERVLCSARSGRLVTVASGGRGKDSTGEKNHASGATVWPSWSAQDADEANEHINLTTGVHGYTASASEINILDGATLTTAELNYVTGATSSIQTQLNTLKNPSTNAQTGTTYTLVLADDNKYVEMNNSSSNAVTIPLNSSVAFPVGAQITVITTGAGLTAVSPASGVTLNYYSPTSNSTARIRARYSAVTLIKRATDTWIAIGNLL
jgi:hypothetical protein